MDIEDQITYFADLASISRVIGETGINYNSRIQVLFDELLDRYERECKPAQDNLLCPSCGWHAGIVYDTTPKARG